jgi:hypothetical protein
MKANPWWRRQFKGSVRTMTLEIMFSFLVAGGITDFSRIGKYRILLFPLLFVGILAILLGVSRKDGGPRLN